ncbi:DNA primase [Dehalococcoidales bacterium]|nr:DNA primase [Dehalococcoidales bacterium]
MITSKIINNRICKMSIIDEVKQRSDIVEVISQYVTLTKAGRTLRALCPFHSEKHPSFFVYPEQQSWHCFGACNSGGDVFSFIMKKQNIGFGDALRLLGQKAGITIPSRSEPEREEKTKLYQVNEAAGQYFHNLLLNSPAGEKARSYLASRGLSLKTITEFQLGFSPNSWEALKQYLMERGYSESELLTAGLIIETEAGKTHDRFRNRLMFPIKDIKERTTGFGARVLDDSLPKYLNSPQTPIFDKSSCLYGINLAKTAIRQQNMVVIVEGYMDVITAHQNGFSNVVASMGTSVTEKQVSTLNRLTKNIALALDADAAGEEAMLRCVGYENILNAEVKVIILPSGKDPDDVIREDSKIWQKLMEEALPVIDYTFNMIATKLDLTTAKDKTLVVGKLLDIIAEIKDSVRQAHYLQKLARLVKVSERSIEAALRKIKPDSRTRKPSQEARAGALRSLFSSPIEEYCLALLLQHPELKVYCHQVKEEYFENSQNREIFIAWQKTSDLLSLKRELDAAIWEHLDFLLTKSLPPTAQLESEFTDCILRLREKFLRSLEIKRGMVLALEAESGGTAAELAKQKEQGIEVSTELREVFIQRSQRGGKNELRAY